MSDTNEILGVILAGGQARRMGGGDKCLAVLAGRPLLGWIIERFAPQVSHIILNANGDAARFADFNLPVVADTVPNSPGPLGGILAAMDWCRINLPATRWIASCPGDAPFIPPNLVQKFRTVQAERHSDLVTASSNGQVNPVCGLWHVDLAGDLRRALVDEGIHKVDAWTARYRLATVEFPTDPIDPFFNINRPEDLAAAEALLASRSGKPV